jgi:alkylated DNA repair dioxygenase AlkB
MTYSKGTTVQSKIKKTPIQNKVKKQAKMTIFTPKHNSKSVSENNEPTVWIDADKAKVEYFPTWMTEEQSKIILNHLLSDDTKFKQYEIKMFNKPVKTPRLECAFCDPQINLKGYTHREIHPWTDEMLNLKVRLEKELTEHLGEKVEFEYALANIYKDGSHYIGYHADKENRGTTIASISLGAERKFNMKKISDGKVVVNEILKNGSMLVMTGATQDLYKHALPKTKACDEMRINITFRRRR